MTTIRNILCNLHARYFLWRTLIRTTTGTWTTDPNADGRYDAPKGLR